MVLEVPWMEILTPPSGWRSRMRINPRTAGWRPSSSSQRPCGAATWAHHIYLHGVMLAWNKHSLREKPY